MEKIIVIKDGLLIQPDLHDALIKRIDFLGKQVILFFKTPADETVILSLEGVKQMTSRDLAEGNIVLDISVQTGDEFNSEILDKLLPNSSKTLINCRAVIVEMLKAKELSLMHISPSYGGEITALVKSIVWQCE